MIWSTTFRCSNKICTNYRISTHFVRPPQNFFLSFGIKVKKLNYREGKFPIQSAKIILLGKGRNFYFPILHENAHWQYFLNLQFYCKKVGFLQMANKKFPQLFFIWKLNFLIDHYCPQKGFKRHPKYTFFSNATQISPPKSLRTLPHSPNPIFLSRPTINLHSHRNLTHPTNDRIGSHARSGF